MFINKMYIWHIKIFLPINFSADRREVICEFSFPKGSFRFITLKTEERAGLRSINIQESRKYLYMFFLLHDSDDDLKDIPIIEHV